MLDALILFSCKNLCIVLDGGGILLKSSSTEAHPHIMQSAFKQDDMKSY